MKKKLLILLLMLPLALFSQSINPSDRIYGQVVSEFKSPAEYVTARLLLAKDSTFVQGTTTDKNGRFEFPMLPRNIYLLEIRALGFQQILTGPLEISPESPQVELNLVLVKKNSVLDEVTIKGTAPVIETELGKTILNIDKSIIATGSSVIDLLLYAPGVIVDKEDRLSLKGKQGVVVLIDNKPLNLSGEDLAVMLRNMDAGNISKVEVMSTPSARYDSGGSAGIINIKTKKNNLPGLNGNLNGALGYANATQLLGTSAINYKHKNLNIMASYNYSHNNRINGTKMHRAVLNNQSAILFDEDGEMAQMFNNHALKGALDYSFNSRHMLSILASGVSNRGSGSGSNITWMMNPAFKVDSFLNATNITNKKFTNNSYNLNYRAKLDTAGMEFSIDIDYSNFEKNTFDQLYNYYYTNSRSVLKPSRIYRSLAPSLIIIKAAKTDFSYPIKNGIIETGVKSSLISTDNNYRFEQQKENSWITDAGKTNHFKFEEAINSGYINFSYTLKKLALQAGIRAEHTYSTGNSLTTNILVDTAFLRVFPTVSVSYKLSEKGALGASLSQRIDRPGYEDLNPFLFMQDEYSYNQGNPYLRPQYSNNLELSFNSGNALNLTAGYSKTKNVMVTVTEQNDETKVTKAIRKNMEKETSLYIGANTAFPVSKQWGTSGNISLFHLGYQDPHLNSGKIALYLSVNNQITFKHGLRLEVQSRYQSPMTYGIFTISHQYQMDGGLQKQLFKNRSSFKLSITDIFNSKRSRLNTTFKNMNLDITERSNTRQARLTFSYRFGQNSGKLAGNRKTVSDDEAKRVKGH